MKKLIDWVKEQKDKCPKCKTDMNDGRANPLIICEENSAEHDETGYGKMPISTAVKASGWLVCTVEDWKRCPLNPENRGK